MAGRVLISRATATGHDGWVDGLTHYLAWRSITVQRALSGREAISLVKRGGLDAAILSATTPHMDELSVLRIVRSMDSGLPCVMVTADASRSALQEALALGAYSVVTEPVNLDELTRVTVGLFRRHFEWKLD